MRKEIPDFDPTATEEMAHFDRNVASSPIQPFKTFNAENKLQAENDTERAAVGVFIAANRGKRSFRSDLGDSIVLRNLNDLLYARDTLQKIVRDLKESK